MKNLFDICKDTIKNIKNKGTTITFSFSDFKSDFCVSLSSINIQQVQWSKEYFKNYFNDCIIETRYSVFASIDTKLFNYLCKLFQNLSLEEFGFNYIDSDFYVAYMKNNYNQSISFFVVYLKEKEVLTISSEHNNDYYVAPMRMVRAFFLLELSKNGFFLHAGGASKNSKAFCVLGDRYSGKTTFVVNSVVNQGFSFISNDKVFIHPDGDNYSIMGLPISIGIRLGTIRCIKGLFQLFFDKINCFDNNIDKDDFKIDAKELAKTDKKIIMSPNEFCDTFHCGLTMISQLNYILIPQYDACIRKARIVEVVKLEEKRQILNNQYLDCVTPEQAILEPMIEIDKNKMRKRYMSYLDDIIHKLPFYTVMQNEKVIDDCYAFLKI